MLRQSGDHAGYQAKLLAVLTPGTSRITTAGLADTGTLRGDLLALASTFDAQRL